MTFFPPQFQRAALVLLTGSLLLSCAGDGTERGKEDREPLPTAEGAALDAAKLPTGDRASDLIAGDAAVDGAAAPVVAAPPRDARLPEAPAAPPDAAADASEGTSASDGAAARDTRPAGMEVCARPTCGGSPIGTWDLVGWCSGVEGSGAATGSLVFDADGHYSWTITGGPPRLNVRPVPEVGSWRVEKNEIVTKTTSANGAYFPPRGSLVYRGDLGARSVFCADRDTLTIRAEEKVRFNWTLRRHVAR